MLKNGEDFHGFTVLQFCGRGGFGEVYLVRDITGKKLAFVKAAADALDVKLSIHEGRAEQASELRERFDCVCARAVAPLPALCELCLPLVRVGGRFIAMKGASASDELRAAANAIKILGARVIAVKSGTRTLKDAVDEAFKAYLRDPVNQIYCIGSVVGPHPFPMMVRDFQAVIGVEARKQMMQMTGRLPDNVVACVGGGSNAMGIFSAFLDDSSVSLYGVEPAGMGLETGNHAASITCGKPGILHGFRTLLIQNEKGEPLPVYSIASGLDYPGVGPQHCHLHDIKRVQYTTITDREAVEAFYALSRMEGIIPALESSHAVAYAAKLAEGLDRDETVLVNLSGRGDKDIDFVMQNYPLADYEPGAESGNSYKDFLSRIQSRR